MKTSRGSLHGSLPRRYARALIQIAREDDQVEAYGRSLGEMLRALESSAGGPSFLRTLADDTIDVNQRLAAIEELAEKVGAAPLFKNFLCLLVRKERVGLLTEIGREYQRFQDEILGIVRVTVVTPGQPEAGLLQKVETVLAEKLKKKIVPRGEADPALIGGVVLRVDHTVYDGSVKRELERIKENILRG
ncbi:MAG TPA: ATP synthase F1 subunit delta [bacterium]|nr:ATP synthase F1 subunit delta [bacterium]